MNRLAARLRQVRRARGGAGRCWRLKFTATTNLPKVGAGKLDFGLFPGEELIR